MIFSTDYLKYNLMRAMLLKIPVLILLFFLAGCADKNNRPVKQGLQYQQTDQPKAGKSQIKHPDINQRIIIGETTQIILETIGSSPEIDSVIFYVGDKKVGKSDSEPFVYNWHITDIKVGENIVRTLVYYENNTTSTNNVSVVVLPAKKPISISYKVLNVYPHDIHAYTQGLVYENGLLYEGTGQYNESSLRKVNIKTGEPSRILNLPG